jgi:hypothetical protein
MDRRRTLELLFRNGQCTRIEQKRLGLGSAKTAMVAKQILKGSGLTGNPVPASTVLHRG